MRTNDISDDEWIRDRACTLANIAEELTRVKKPTRVARAFRKSLDAAWKDLDKLLEQAE